MRVLLTGASGFIGRYLAARLGRQYEVLGTFRANRAPVPGAAELVPLDLERPGAAAALIRERRPDMVVHAAAVSNPDACERDPRTARRVNTEATAEAADAARAAGARFFFFSSDLIFHDAPPPIDEGVEPSPACEYARGKLEAEAAVRSLCPGGVILREALAYGWSPPGAPGFCEGLDRKLAAGERVSLFSDQIRAAVYLGDAAELVARLAGDPGLVDAAGDTLNLAGPEPVSREAFGRAFCAAFGRDPGLIDPVPMASVPLPAMRPRDCSLDGRRLWTLTGFTPRGAADGLRAMAQEK